MQMAAIYTRVSSNRQREAHTIASQTAALVEWATTLDLEVPQQWIFEDEGYSGATLERPGLEQVRDLAAAGDIQVVLVHSPDRLSRKYAYLWSAATSGRHALQGTKASRRLFRRLKGYRRDLSSPIAGLRHRTRTPRECPEGSAPRGGQTDGVRYFELGWPPERPGTGLVASPRKELERRMRAKRPMNRAKTPLQRRAAPIEPPWYVTRMPGGVTGKAREGLPMSINSQFLALGNRSVP